MKAWEERQVRDRKTTPYVKVVSGLPPSKERKYAKVRCPECGAPITYDTHNGDLVALEASGTHYHRHQPPRPDRARNREMVANKEQNEKYAEYQTKMKGGR